MRLVLSLLAFIAASTAIAQVVTFVQVPDAISDMAFPVTLSYSGFETVYTDQMGMIVSLNTALGDYLSDGKISLGTAGSGTGTVIITPPLGFITENMGLNVTLRAFIIKYTDILQNVSTAYTYALKDANLTDVPVTTRPSYGAAGSLKLIGLNIAGGELGAKYDVNSALYFRQLGFNSFGLWTSWSRLVPNPATGALKNSEVIALYNAATYITESLGAFVNLELHDYGRYMGDAIGLGEAKVERFQSVWVALANLFKNNSRVIFSLMNQPHDQNNAMYVYALNVTITAIRQTGATNFIMIQGNRWNSAMNWLNVDEWGAANTETMSTVWDPLSKIILNIHQYLDASHGGSFDGCINTNIGSTYLSAVTLWLRQNNFKGFLGEFGSSNDSTCQQAVDDLLDFVEANSDVWIGWQWWSMGTFLSDTSYTVQPTVDEDGNYVADSKQSWLTNHLPAKCIVNFPAQSVTAKTSSCLILNGLEGNITADANNTAPSDDTGKNGTSKSPGGKITDLTPKAAIHFAIHEQILATIIAMLLVLSVLL